MTAVMAPRNGARFLIKLPRKVVRACHKKRRRSGSFSHHQAYDGKQAIIYCTDDNGNPTDIFHGTIKRVSRKARQWVLVADRMLMSLA